MMKFSMTTDYSDIITEYGTDVVIFSTSTKIVQKFIDPNRLAITEAKCTLS